jgi:hypothetical protein
VLNGITIDGFIFSSMNFEIGLAIAVQVQFAQRDSAIDRVLENARRDGPSVPRHGLRKPYVYGDQPHD